MAARHLWCSLPAALMVLGCAGCLVSHRSREETSGRYVGRATFAQIEPGSSKQDWVLATLGEPTSKCALDDGSTLWSWRYSKERKSSGAVFLVLGTSSSSETENATFVQFRDGVVVKAWQD